MSREEKVFAPSHPLEPGDRYGVLSGFDPGIKILPAGFQVAPPFRPLPTDIFFENASEDLRVANPIRDLPAARGISAGDVGKANPCDTRYQPVKLELLSNVVDEGFQAASLSSLMPSTNLTS